MSNPMNIDLSYQVVNINVVRGNAWSISCTAPFDLTGSTVEAQIRETWDTPGDPLAVIDVSITDAPAGQFMIGQEAALASGVWDLRIKNPSGLPRTYAGGNFSLSRRVTQ